MCKLEREYANWNGKCVNWNGTYEDLFCHHQYFVVDEGFWFVFFQANFRGYRLRKRLRAALQHIQQQADTAAAAAELSSEGGEEFDYEKEVKLDYLDEVRNENLKKKYATTVTHPLCACM